MQHGQNMMEVTNQTKRSAAWAECDRGHYTIASKQHMLSLSIATNTETHAKNANLNFAVTLKNRSMCVTCMVCPVGAHSDKLFDLKP